MSESAAKVLSQMARHTGLNRETIKDLMKKGWYYEETSDGIIFRHTVKK